MKKKKKSNNTNKFNLPKTRKRNATLYKSANNEFATNVLAVKKFRIVLATLVILFLLLIVRLI